MVTKQAVRSLKATNIGPSSSITSLMVRITWTSAPVVKITARQDFLMQASTVNTKDGSIVAAVSVKVFAGAVLYFAASAFDGWYYVCRMNASSVVSCTCPHYSNKHCCKHQPLVKDRAAGIVRRSVEEWKAATKRDKVRQRAEKDADLAKIAQAKQVA